MTKKWDLYFYNKLMQAEERLSAHRPTLHAPGPLDNPVHLVVLLWLYVVVPSNIS